jgi:hypothetical protein
MATATLQPLVKQRVNHVEFVHPPGDRELAKAFFDLLGFTPVEQGPNDEILLAIVDQATFEDANNDNYLAGREVRPEQWQFDQTLAEALRQEPLASAYAHQREMLEQKPQWGMHFGVCFDSVADWEAAVARVLDVAAIAPKLEGRVRMLKVFRPGDPDQKYPINQAFVWTDIIASGSLALGQRIELTTRIQ